MHKNQYYDIHEAYLGTLKDIYENPEYISAPRDMQIKETLNYSFRVINPVSEAIVTKDLDRNAIIANYTKKEMILYSKGEYKAEEFAKASKFWDQIKNPDGTINSAYGHLLWFNPSQGNSEFETDDYKTPWEWAKQSLINDKDSRQAVLMFALPEHRWFGNKDQVCTLNGQFFIRNDELHLTITMRSNDLVKGLVYDLPFFVYLMDKMLVELKPYYPALKKGVYTHIAGSMHIYDNDNDKVRAMLGEA